jgi:hypothetical protein
MAAGTATSKSGLQTRFLDDFPICVPVEFHECPSVTFLFRFVRKFALQDLP